MHHGLSGIICTVEAGGVGWCTCQGCLSGAPISGASEDRGLLVLAGKWGHVALVGISGRQRDGLCGRLPRCQALCHMPAREHRDLSHHLGNTVWGSCAAEAVMACLGSRVRSAGMSGQCPT